MKKIRILIFINLISFLNCKSKKTLTFQQKYEKANKLYEQKKYSKAAEIYDDIYQEVPNKIENVKILQKLADCNYFEKEFKNCFNFYKRLFETINDENRLMNGYKMCNCLFNTLEKNNKRDIARAEILLEILDSILEEYENSKNEKEILDDFYILKKCTFDKIVEKKFNIILTYEKLEMFDSVVTYAKNFILKYHDSKFFNNVCNILIKNQFLSANNFANKNKKKISEENKNILFNQWKEIILTFDTYKEQLQNNKESNSFYQQALKNIF